jgi:hypothetical protein
MFRCFLAATVTLLALVGTLAAEDYRGLITELTKSNVIIKVRGDKTPVEKKLPLAEKVVVVEKKDKDSEDKLTLERLQKRIKNSDKQSGVLGTVTTDNDGNVIKIAVFGRPLSKSSSTAFEKAMAIIQKADQIEFYSIEPFPDEKAPRDKLLRGYVVLGKTVIKDAKARKAFVEEFDEAAGRGRMAKCFDPRHGIRATHDGKSMDVLICFHCGYVNLYEGKGNEPIASFSIAAGAQPAFDKILKDGKVPLAKPAEK